MQEVWASPDGARSGALSDMALTMTNGNGSGTKNGAKSGLRRGLTIAFAGILVGIAVASAIAPWLLSLIHFGDSTDTAARCSVVVRQTARVVLYLQAGGGFLFALLFLLGALLLKRRPVPPGEK